MQEVEIPRRWETEKQSTPLVSFLLFLLFFYFSLFLYFGKFIDFYIKKEILFL